MALLIQKFEEILVRLITTAFSSILILLKAVALPASLKKNTPKGKK
jgi:hypothetical protein